MLQTTEQNESEVVVGGEVEFVVEAKTETEAQEFGLPQRLCC